VSFVDYGNSALRTDDVVLLRVGNLYIQYNRAKGYNIDTASPDTVTITHALGDNEVSTALAALKPLESFSSPNFGKTGTALVIQVCEVVKEAVGTLDYATVNIHFENQKSLCPRSSVDTDSLDVFPTSSPLIF
jgi:hypothetical protein